MTRICTICARGGSKGLPGKNIRSLNGKPLIAYSILQALSSGLFKKVYVSTDCPTIAKIAEQFGATVPYLRPNELGGDDAPKIPVIQHLVKYLEEQGQVIDTILDLDPTSPLREQDDIHNALALLEKGAEVVISGYKSNKNPYFNMVEKNSLGFAELSKSPVELYAGRQACPPVFAMNASIYVWQRSALDRGIWSNERVAFYEMPIERSIDIDTMTDWYLVEILMAKKLGQDYYAKFE